MIAIGITTNVPATKLDSLAGLAEFIVRVRDFDALEDAFDQVAYRICALPPGEQKHNL